MAVGDPSLAGRSPKERRVGAAGAFCSPCPAAPKQQGLNWWFSLAVSPQLVSARCQAPLAHVPPAPSREVAKLSNKSIHCHIAPFDRANTAISPVTSPPTPPALRLTLLHGLGIRTRGVGLGGGDGLSFLFVSYLFFFFFSFSPFPGRCTVKEPLERAPSSRGRRKVGLWRGSQQVFR